MIVQLIMNMPSHEQFCLAATGAAPFLGCSEPLLPFSHPPHFAYLDPLFLVGLCLWGKAPFPSRGTEPLGEKLEQQKLLIAACGLLSWQVPHSIPLACLLG